MTIFFRLLHYLFVLSFRAFHTNSNHTPLLKVKAVSKLKKRRCKITRKFEEKRISKSKKSPQWNNLFRHRSIWMLKPLSERRAVGEQNIPSVSPHRLLAKCNEEINKPLKWRDVSVSGSTKKATSVSPTAAQLELKCLPMWWCKKKYTTSSLNYQNWSATI